MLSGADFARRSLDYGTGIEVGGASTVSLRYCRYILYSAPPIPVCIVKELVDASFLPSPFPFPSL